MKTQGTAEHAQSYVRSLSTVNLLYNLQVIKEGLRLGGPVGLTFREPMKDTTLGGYMIPAHATAAVSNTL